MRQLRDDGMSYREIAKRFDSSPGQVHAVCNFTRRAQSPAYFKMVEV
jgi:DNA-directed RNA polymerase specialized sigma24 family protein